MVSAAVKTLYSGLQLMISTINLFFLFLSIVLPVKHQNIVKKKNTHHFPGTKIARVAQQTPKQSTII